MSTELSKIPPLKRLKERAKALKNRVGIAHSDALKATAELHGFLDWNQVVSFYAAPTGYIFDSRVETNLARLAKLGIEFTVFYPTETILRKSIIDATQSVRAFFKENGYHNYERQAQGQEHKVITEAYLVNPKELTRSRASLYRPKTKVGDPRMWFKGLPDFCQSTDVIAIIFHNGCPYLINISQFYIDEHLLDMENEVTCLLRSIRKSHQSISEELLFKLKEIAKEPFKAAKTGDTAIGYTLELLLGIEANSSKEPDYKGIELKSGRGGKNRSNLFAQVADWKISPFKKSAAILDAFGYQRGEDFKLYCTVKSGQSNPQGLMFKCDIEKDVVEEWNDQTNQLVAIWPGTLLRKRLRQKHSETFWIEAESSFIDGVEHFQLLRVCHTKSPVLSQLLPLIEQGIITMDHLIKRSGKSKRVSEKGPLFKLDKKNLELLFPAPTTYELTI